MGKQVEILLTEEQTEKIAEQTGKKISAAMAADWFEHEELNRELRLYSVEHGGYQGRDPKEEHWSIYYNFDEDAFATQMCRELKFGDVWFVDQQTAENAIDLVVMPFLRSRPTFVW